MDAVSDPAVHTVVIMSSSQIGKTEILNNIVGYHIDQDPAPMLLLQPTLEMAEAWSKDRLAPMLRDTPSLKNSVKDPRSRDSGNTVRHKTFTGGHITMAGANSPASLASRPIRIVLADEIDRFPPSAGSEGDPVNLARKRSTTFWNRKLILVSTPTIKGHSRIEVAYEKSDQRRLRVPCPDCGGSQELKWAQVKWNEGEPETAAYACEHCGVLWDDAARWEAISRSDWLASADFNGVAGFRLNELASPWVKLSETVRNFLDAKPHPEQLKTWVNTALGETWEEEGQTVNAEGVAARTESYDPDSLPDEVVLLTVGVDVQGDRLEAECVGWGADEESWGVEYRIFRGDPDQAGVWSELAGWLNGTYTTENGRTLRIEAACIDSGFKADKVYRFTAANAKRRWWAIKGVSGAGKPVWPRRTSRAGRTRAPLFTLGVDAAKEVIYGRLNKINEPGPGYMHWPALDCYDEEYYAQLGAESVRTKYVRGVPVREWYQRKERNEALDCRVYAYAAMIGRNIDLNRRADRVVDLEPEVQEEAPEQWQAVAPKPRPRRRAGRRGGFVSNY